jgi:hypothetical protein
MLGLAELGEKRGTIRVVKGLDGVVGRIHKPRISNDL